MLLKWLKRLCLTLSARLLRLQPDTDTPAVSVLNFPFSETTPVWLSEAPKFA